MGRPQSEETKRKISERTSLRWRELEYREKHLDSMKGRKLSQETKEKLSLIHTGLKQRPWKEDDKRKLSGIMKIVSPRGIESQFWKEQEDRLTEFHNSIRSLYKYKDWVISVLSRDNFTCQDCGERDNLHVHHLKQFSIILREHNIQSIEEALECNELWDIMNGKTVCPLCHSKYGNHKGVANKWIKTRKSSDSG